MLVSDETIQVVKLKKSVRIPKGEVKVSPEMLRSLRAELNQSLTEFGLTLKRAIDPREERGYTRQYISRLEHGQDVITPELVAAFYNLAGRMNMGAEARRRLASENMAEVMSKKYGPDWLNIMLNDGVMEYWR